MAPTLQRSESEISPSAQRRGAFRVSVPNPNWIDATILGEDGDAAGAVILDLSRMGMAAKMPPDVLLERGMRLRCRLVLDNEPVETEITIRNCTQIRAGTRVGMEFTDLSPMQDSVISRAVFRLQRYLLRRKQRKGGVLN